MNRTIYTMWKEGKLSDKKAEELLRKNENSLKKQAEAKFIEARQAHNLRGRILTELLHKGEILGDQT